MCLKLWVKLHIFRDTFLHLLYQDTDQDMDTDREMATDMDRGMDKDQEIKHNLSHNKQQGTITLF